MGNEPLFPTPAVPSVELSKGWAHPVRRLTPGQSAKWSALKLKGDHPCHECAQRQHETRGAVGPRRQATHRRRHPDGWVLDLCAEHARLWRERDNADTDRRPS